MKPILLKYNYNQLNIFLIIHQAFRINHTIFLIDYVDFNIKKNSSHVTCPEPSGSSAARVQCRQTVHTPHANTVSMSYIHV